MFPRVKHFGEMVVMAFGSKSQGREEVAKFQNVSWVSYLRSCVSVTSLSFACDQVVTTSSLREEEYMPAGDSRIPEGFWK